MVLEETFIKKLFKDNYPIYRERNISQGVNFITEEEYIKNANDAIRIFQDFNNMHGLEMYEMVKVDLFGNRFHSTLTGVPKFIYNSGLVTLNGKKVIGIDLSQAQPSILSELCGRLLANNNYHFQPRMTIL